jgi:hypothetical protein
MGTFLDSFSKSTVEACLHASEVLLLVSGLVLLIGIWGEYRKGEKWKRYLAAFQVMVLAGIGFELLADAGVFLFSESLQRLEGADIQALGEKARVASNKATEAFGMSVNAEDRSDKANSTSEGALDKSTKAESSSLSALDLAKGARQEADSFEKDLVSSKEQIALMSARYKLIQKGEAEFLAAVDLFPGQQIEFQECRALQTDNETNALSGAIREVLTKARWETHTSIWQSCLNGIGVIVYANEGSSARTMSAANSLGKILDKLLRIDRKPSEFSVWEKLRDDPKFSPWNWVWPLRDSSQPLAAETMRISVFARFPQ